MKYKPGQTFFWKGGGFFGTVIKFYNWRTFGSSDLPTHVGIITLVEKDRVQIHEATNQGFVKGWKSKKWLNSQIGKKVAFGEVNTKLVSVLKNAEKYEGIKYGWINIFMHGVSLLVKEIFGGKLKFTDGEKTLHCSEGVSRVLYDSSLKKINFETEYGVPFDSISPAHIYLSKQINILPKSL